MIIWLILAKTGTVIINFKVKYDDMFEEAAFKLSDKQMDVVLYQGKKIVYLNYTKCEEIDEMLVLLHKAVDHVLADNTIKLGVINITNCPVTMEFLNVQKRILKEVWDDRVEHTAVVGATGIKKMLFQAIAMLHRKASAKPFEHEKEAIDWLMSR